MAEISKKVLWPKFGPNESIDLFYFNVFKHSVKHSCFVLIYWYTFITYFIFITNFRT